MREIKFRAWLPVGPWNKAGTERKYEMVGPDALAFEEYKPLAELLAGCENLMQFTGLHDKAGREIYEGDIWKCPLPQPMAYVIRWMSEYSRFVPKSKHGWIASWCAKTAKRGLIIGNICEHPGLLEVPHAKL